MKRNSALRLSSLLFVLLTMVALTACVRTISDDDNNGSDLPTAEPLVMPTAVPLDTPIPEPTAVIEDTTDSATEDAATSEDTTAAEETTDTTDTGETTDVPGTYTVRSGDTLGEIAEQFDVTLEALAAANGITNLDTLDVGQLLNIPTPGTEDSDSGSTTETPDAPPTEEQIHIVQTGENLFRIGLAYGYSVDELAEYNGITNVDALEVGQEIRIPPGN